MFLSKTIQEALERLQFPKRKDAHKTYNNMAVCLNSKVIGKPYKTVLKDGTHQNQKHGQ